MCKEKIFQLPSITNAIISVDQSFTGKIIGESCLTFTINLGNPIMRIQHSEHTKNDEMSVQV